MELSAFLQALTEHNKTGSGYQIHLNSGNLDENSSRHTDIEFGDLYFTDCNTLKNQTMLHFGNMGRKPVEQSGDGTNLYPQEINSCLFIDISKIEAIEDVRDIQDWFEFPSNRVINVYMYPGNRDMSGNRNAVTIGFLS